MRRIAALIALAALVAVGAPGTARGDDIAITAQIVSGTRTITTATLTPDELVDLVPTQSLDAVLAVTVTELAVDGVNDWDVEVGLCGADDDGLMDCDTHPGVLRKVGGAEIDGANMTVDGVLVTPTAVVALPALGAPAVTSEFDAGLPADLSATRTLFTTGGQEPARTYTGSYVSTSTITLEAPADAAVGSYDGFIVVTLVD